MFLRPRGWRILLGGLEDLREKSMGYLHMVTGVNLVLSFMKLSISFSLGNEPLVHL
jgi:hypothetical protein